MSELLFSIQKSNVEWKTLEDIFDIKGGYTPSRSKKEFWEYGTVPWFRMDDIRENGQVLHDSIEKVAPEAVKGGVLFPANSIIVATSATIGVHALITVPYLSNQRFSNLTLKEEYKKRFNIKFLYYYAFVLTEWCKHNTTMSSFASVDMAKFRRFEFPIPTLDLQNKIVQVLDNFTELTAELTAELTVREQQFSYYRESLLSFDEDEVEHLPLGREGVGEFIRGSTLLKKDFTESGVGCIHYGQLYTHYGTYAEETLTFVSDEFAKKARMAKHGDLVIATTSETDEDVCKAVAWLGDDEIAVSNDACIYRHNLNPKYVAYYFQTEHFQKQKRCFITGAKVRRVNADNLAKILIPVPSLEEQARIVSILDKFDALTNSITEGLPREIELRQKQYEYYRDLLLSFPKPEAA